MHGLGGHREKSWTATNGSFWLRDSLPEEIPYARILTYGYNADITRQNLRQWTHQTLPTQAETLLQELTRSRPVMQTENRPVIFICHSLGGLIVKNALILANQHNFDYKDRWKSVRLSVGGILFLGTPHQASPGDRWERMIRNIISVTALENTWSTSSEEALTLLELELEQYKSISADLPVACGFETRPTKIRFLNTTVWNLCPTVMLPLKRTSLSRDPLLYPCILRNTVLFL